MPNRPHDPVDLVRDLSRVVRATLLHQSVRACLLATRDRERAIHFVIESCREGQIPLYHFSIAACRQYDYATLTWHPGREGEADPAALLERVRDTTGGGVFLMEDMVALLRDDGGDRQARMRLADMLAGTDARAGALLVFVEPPEAAARLPAILDEQVVKYQVPYPRGDELAAMARAEIAALAIRRSGQPLPAERVRVYAETVADGLVGTTLKAARDALRDALGGSLNDVAGAAEVLRQRKVERLSRELSMNVLDTREAEMPVGLDNLIAYLEVNRQQMREFGSGRARGILLVGPPGTGKTMLAKAIGRLVDLPVVEFRISALMNSLLGETERRFAQAFATLEALSPSVVFIDEIEKAFSESSERDGGTMMRTTGSLLSWLSDNPYPNFVVGTANSVSRMGEIGLTMTRSERFDTAFFVDVPGPAARESMLRQWLDGQLANPEAAIGTLVPMCDKFSGADIFSVVKQATARARHAQRPLSITDLQDEVRRKQPRVLALYDEFAELRRWGRIHCEPASSEQAGAGGKVVL